MFIVERVTWGVGVMLSAVVGCWVYAVTELALIALGWKEIEL